MSQIIWIDKRTRVRLGKAEDLRKKMISFTILSFCIAGIVFGLYLIFDRGNECRLKDE